MANWQNLKVDIEAPLAIERKFFEEGLLGGFHELELPESPVITVAEHQGPVVMAPRRGQLGTVLIHTCWSVGMVAKACGDLLKFLPDPLRHRSSLPPDIDTLAASAIPVDSTFLPAEDGIMEIRLEELLILLEAQFPAIMIQPSPSALRQWVTLRVPASACLTQLMDLCAASLDVDWTWSGNVIILGPVSGQAQSVCCQSCQVEKV